MKCPNCPDVTLSLSEREGVELDYCPQCRGVWLDRGELDKLIDRSGSRNVRGEGDAEAFRRDGSRHGSQYGSKHGGHGAGSYRRKSWLQDIFD